MAVLSLAAVCALAGCGNAGGPPPAAHVTKPPAAHVQSQGSLALLLGPASHPATSVAPRPAPDPKLLDTSSHRIELSSYSVVPPAITLPLHHTVFLNAVGIRPDGSKIERTSVSHWTVLGDPIGTVSPIGALTAEAPGVAVVMAEDHVSGLSAYSIVTVPAGP